MSFLQKIAVGFRSVFQRKSIEKGHDEKLDEVLEMGAEELPKQGSGSNDAISTAGIERGSPELTKKVLLELRRPPYVYKYCSAERGIQIMRDLTFFMAPAGALNDLFEFRLNSLYSESPDSKYRVFAKRLLSEGWFQDFNEAYEAARSLDSESIDSTYASFKHQQQAMLDRISKNSGVTCFTAHRNNQRLWATYGDNHSGVCIEFSAAENQSGIGTRLMPVFYTGSRLPICPSELVDERMRLNLQMCCLFLCAKHSHWHDENEWRLLLLADSPQQQKDRIVPFERKAIARVFVGPRVREDHERSIHAVAASRTPPIPVFKRIIDESLAKEEVLGVEQITSFDQLVYWAERSPKQ